jgi:4-amino-4-deoxy-L-arabinose transferase-like glycosyltransferase
MHRLTQDRLIAALFLFSLIVRLLALATFPAPPLDDAGQAILKAADVLRNGEGFRGHPLLLPPMATMFAALCLSLFGGDQISVKIAQAVVDSLTIVIIFLITRETFDIQTAVVAATISSIYPFFIYLTISIATEPLFTFLLSAFVLSSLYAVRSDKAFFYFVSGVLLGAATLTRAATQFFPLVFLMLLLVMKRSRRILLWCAAFCLSFVLVVLPWTVRNYVALDDFIPVATGGGIVVQQGSSEKFLTIDGRKPEAFPENPPPQGLKPSQQDKYFMKAGLDRLKMRLQTDPVGFVAFMAKKFLRLWYATDTGRNHHITLLVQVPIYIFALMGLVLRSWKGQSLIWIPACVVIYFVALHWFGLPLFRYMIPVMPYVIGFAAFAIVSLKNKWILRAQGRP